MSVSGLRIAACRVAATVSASATIARDDVGLRIGLDDRNTGVTGLPQRTVERDRAEQGDAQLVGEPEPAALAERVTGHVLDHAEQLLAGLLRHHRRARRDVLCERLRCRDDEHLRPRQQLAERDRHVAGARGHVDHDRVQSAPVDVGEELLERAVEHRAAPHHRCVLFEEVADRDQLQAAAHRRDDHLVDDDRPLVDAEHVRDRVAVDVCVDHPDLLSEAVERRGEVDGQRRLADSALAARDGDHTRRRVERDRLLRPAATELGGQRRLLVRAHHVERELDATHAREAADVLRDLILERVAEGATRDCECDRDRDVGAVDLDGPDHVELGHGLAQLGIDHALERAQDVVAVHGHVRSVAAASCASCCFTPRA